MRTRIKGNQSISISIDQLSHIIAVAALVLMVVHAFIFRYTPDDALISFRYALNIARGYGPVFNVGQHVEGYTSPLWVFVLGAAQRIGFSIESTAFGLSVGAAALAVLMLPRLSQRLGYKSIGLDALLLAANTSFAVWAGASMELTLFALVLVIASIVFLSKERVWTAGILFATLALVRPEGLLFGGLAFLFTLWSVIKREPNAIKNCILFFVLFALPVGLHLLWRLSYYGYPLPNTFYDKVGFSLAQVQRGASYLGAAAWEYLVPLTLFMFIGLTTVKSYARLYVAAGLILYLGYVALVGGDWMVSHRLITPVMPLVTLFAAAGIMRLWELFSRQRIWVEMPVRRRWIVGAGTALVIMVLVVLDLAPSFTVEPQQSFRDGGEQIAYWLDAHCPTNLRIAVYAAGALPYYAPDFEIVDMFGLADEQIAHLNIATIGEGIWAGHEKFSAQIVQQRNPNIFVFQGALGDKPITTPDEWREEPPAHLTGQFIDDIDFWANHSIQTAPMPDGKYFNFIVLNPYPCK